MAKKQAYEEHHVTVRIYRKKASILREDCLANLDRILVTHSMRYNGKFLPVSKRLFPLAEGYPLQPDEFLLSGDPEGSWDVSVIFRDAALVRRRRM